MKPKKQLVRLTLSKKLKELGVKQESVFWWIKSIHWEIHQSFSHSFGQYEQYSAFTVAELGEMLPEEYVSNRNGLRFWFCCDMNSDDDCLQGELKEADARAKMLIYLIENNLIKNYG